MDVLTDERPRQDTVQIPHGDGEKLESSASVEQFRSLLTNIHSVLENREPQQWWRGVYRELARVQRHPEQYTPEIRGFIADYGDAVRNLLVEELDQDPAAKEQKDDPALISHQALTMIHSVAKLIEQPEEHEHKTEITRIPIELLVKNNDRMRLSGEVRDGKNITILEIKSDTGQWHAFPLPPADNMVHKGGFPRVVLKILAGAPASTIEAELPPNDFDVIAAGDPQQSYEDAKTIGVDLEGVEMVDKLDFEFLAKTRDVDLNGCFMGKNEFIFSSDAYKSAQSGKIAIEGFNRGIYGGDRFYYQGVELFKNRGLMRLFKTVAEGKALSFDFIPLNQQIDLGVYWLVLMRKFSNKKNFGELANRLYYLGKQCGQVRPGEESVIDVLDRVHAENTFFNFDDPVLDQVGVAKWLNKKLMKYTDTVFRGKYKISLGHEFTRTLHDTNPFEISLKGYESQTDNNHEVESEWNEFLQRSSERNKQDVVRPLIFPNQ